MPEARRTVRVAEAVVPVPPFVEVTAPVVFRYDPTVADVTFTLITHGVPEATDDELRLTEADRRHSRHRTARAARCGFSVRRLDDHTRGERV